MIRGITFSEQVFRSEDFAHYMNFFLNGCSGITRGCKITNNGTNVTLGTGYFFVKGRLVNVEETEIVDSTQFTSGYNRIVFEIDLTKDNTVAEFNQGYIKVLTTETLTQEDIDGEGNVYQFPLCNFQWSGTVITDFKIDAPTMVLDNIMADIATNYATVYAQMENAVKSLEGEGFAKKAVYYPSVMSVDQWVTDIKAYSFESEFPFDEYDIEIQPDECSIEQFEAWSNAELVGSGSANYATALGSIPEIDIPIIIRVVKKYD